MKAELIHWTREYRSEVFGEGYTVWVGVYPNQESFDKMHDEYFGSATPAGMSGICWRESNEDARDLIRVCFVRDALGSGLVAHEFLHASSHAYRKVTGIERAILSKDDVIEYGADYHDEEIYSRDPEEVVCDMLDAMVSDFWTQWYKRNGEQS